jgi:hypothetical protein
MINTGKAAMDLTLELADVLCTDCPRAARVVDVWAADTTLGSAGPAAPVQAEGSYTAKGVRAHETVLLRLTPKAKEARRAE